MEEVYHEVVTPLLQSILKDCIYIVAFAVGALLLYLVFRYIAPFLKEKLGETRYNALVSRVKGLMCAAERNITGVAAGLSRSQYVIKLVKEKFPTLDDAYIQTIIDGLMAPMENEGLVNVSTDVGFEDYLSRIADLVLLKINDRSADSSNEHIEKPDPEALDAPPID